MTDTRDSVEWLRMMRDHSALSDCKPHFARIADEITRLRSDIEVRNDIIGLLRAQLRMLGHMPVVVENKEAEEADLARKVDFVSAIDGLKSENERLREALEEIAAPAAYAMPDADRVQAYRDVARDAIRSLAHGDSNDR